MKKMILAVPTYRLLDAEFCDEVEIADQPLNGYQATDHFMVHRGMFGYNPSARWQLTHIPTRRSICGSAYWRLRREAVAAAQALEESLDWDFKDPSLPKVAMQALVRCICEPLRCSPFNEYGCTQTARNTTRAQMNRWRARMQDLVTEPSPTNDVPPKGEKNELRVDGPL